MYLITPVLMTSRRLLLWNIVRYTFLNISVYELVWLGLRTAMTIPVRSSATREILMCPVYFLLWCGYLVNEFLWFLNLLFFYFCIERCQIFTLRLYNAAPHHKNLTVSKSINNLQAIFTSKLSRSPIHILELLFQIPQLPTFNAEKFWI